MSLRFDIPWLIIKYHHVFLLIKKADKDLFLEKSRAHIPWA